MGKTLNMTMLKAYIEDPSLLPTVKSGISEEHKIGALFLTLPKERVTIKRFDKWRDFILTHLRSKVADC